MPDAAEYILVQGARTHNLRNLDVAIPRDVLVAMTGVSGSGKSSLAFDTLFAEGQRRYLESLSTSTRQFFEQLERPDVELIDGLPPTLSIGQQARAASPRSTLATTTEVYDYLRLAFARAGQAHCPQCGKPISRQTPRAIVEQILASGAGRKAMILATLVRGRKGAHREVLERIVKDGFVRARVDGEIVDAAEPLQLAKSRRHTIDVVVDRIVIKPGVRDRIAESVDLALKQGAGSCIVCVAEGDGWRDRLFSSRFACPDCGSSYPELEPRSFSFNSPYGACGTCGGMGTISSDGADDDASAVCPSCGGARLGPQARAVTLGGKPIHQWTALTVSQAADEARRLRESLKSPAEPSGFTPQQALAAAAVLPEIVQRLDFLVEVGLDYVTLNRASRTLSGGEFQRARLASSLGSGLVGVCYILDEPTVGLHTQDTRRLIEALFKLRDQGNTVLVVEHDLEVVRAADHVIDLGPGAGGDGGWLVAAGTPADIAQSAESLTGRFLSVAPRPQPSSRATSKTLKLSGAGRHNLQNVTVEIPLAALTCVTGVSGSGKSSLVVETLAPAVRKRLAGEPLPPDLAAGLEGVGELQRVVEIDQSPLGRSGRSNPATYSGVWNEVRKILAKTREARLRGYTPRRFSFNSSDGRCATCQGRGTRRLKMSFLPDLQTVCPDCRGRRFNRATLAVRFRGRNAADVLALRFDEAAEFFSSFARLRATLDLFVEIGLGYLPLGQSSLTLSGGESQRVRLATELARGAARGGNPSQSTLFVLDEPTTGLHPADIQRILAALRRLVEQGHTVIVVEHQLDLIAAADWIVDLGPGAGAAGGQVVAAGRPHEIAQTGGATGEALRDYFWP